MKKLYFTSIFILVSFFSFSQNFPYLNASTGNDGEYPVDKDTNIYMFQGGRISKVDKNFNSVWSYTYTGISFGNILLSKTGSMYFIATSGSAKGVFGKIKADGNLAWIKPIQGILATVSGTVFTGTGDCLSLLLDRNNDLVVTGNMQNIGSGPNSSTSYIFKCDTNGVPLKFKTFRSAYGTNLVILNDSSGIYKLMGSGPILSATVLSIHSYSDLTDNFIKFQSLVLGCGSGGSYANWQYYRSKINSKSFYLFARVTNSVSDYNGVVKATDNAQIKWVSQIHASPLGIYQAAQRMEEDNKGNVFASVSCGGSCPTYTSAFVRTDSNGVRDSYFSRMLSGYNIGSSFPYQIPNHSPRVIHDNNYYFDMWGYSFPNNPLTIQRYNSSLLLPCASTVSAISNCFSAGYIGLAPPTVTIMPVSSYTLGVFTTPVVPTTYSVNPNFCTVLGLENIQNNMFGIKIYPNPANDKLHIESEQLPEKIQIFDLNGKVIKNLGNTKDISVADIPQGIYFIRIKTDKGEFNKKFIKE